MSMLDFGSLRALVCVAREGSFTRAANCLHRTQPSVSHQIRKLEEMVGERLLERSRSENSVRLTRTGEILVGYAWKILDLVHEAEEVLKAELEIADEHPERLQDTAVSRRRVNSVRQ
ncbi:LysR family transcriptional regulator [Paraburkholderia sp. 5N]|jgi:DNA-binding transcriptional LysR family regulator|uniref:LysR family transcriptional regulator n=2 Tax=Paraburkholderia elongata TaxID=2675747 RepID=A0A972SG79_9BURK|nr:LysR family transcriptional regulator [Paraburkholderia elongata]